MSNKYYNDGLTLGEIIDKLEKLPPDANIIFDFGGAEVTTLDSYRGYYDQLALGYDGSYGATIKTVRALLDDCKKAIDSTYTGWKGGDYVMTRDTNVFVANPGNTSDTYIVDIVMQYSDWYVLKTATDIEGNK